MSNSSPPAVNTILSGGIIEVAALTVLIGSRTAESLALGIKGPAGLPWAVMSIFSMGFVVRACVSAITPGWLLETLAVRNPETDAAIGWSLDLGMTNLHCRAPIGAAIGIVRKILPEVSTKSVKEDARDVYAFDRITSAYLGVIPATRLSDDLKVYVSTRDPHRMSKFNRNAWEQALGLAISSIKLVEVIVLWRRKAVMLSMISGAGWAFFFLGASALLALQLADDYRDSQPNIDILTGKLPTPPISAGGDRKLVLGIPPNPRESIVWKIFWFLGSLVCTSSMFVTYIILSWQDTVTFYTWMSFQVVWLASRSVFFHFARGTDTMSGHPSFSVRHWEGLQSQFKERVRGLVFALSRYEMHVHPRGSFSYRNDLQTVDKLGEVWETFHLGDYDNVPEIRFSAVGIVGDTLLMSVSYVFGSSENLTIESLYDSAIILLTLKDGTLVSIPCARVCSDVPLATRMDPENPHEREFPPRGAANSGTSAVSWNYWIPCDREGLWLQLQHSVYKKLEGDVMAKVVTDQHISEHLGRGELYISLKDVEEVKEIVRHSRAACRMIADMLQC